MGSTRVIDGDGHVNEDLAAIAQLLPGEYGRMAAAPSGLGLFNVAE